MERDEIKELIREVLHESFEVLAVHHIMPRREVYALMQAAVNGSPNAADKDTEDAKNAVNGALRMMIRAEARRYASETLAAVGTSGRNIQLPY